MLPDWRNSSKDPKHPLWECDDDFQMMLATACVLYGFDLPKFDLWLKELPDCQLKTECLERRRLATAALLANNESIALWHLEFMHEQRRSHQREQFLLPHARRGNKTLRSASAGGKTRAQWPSRKDELQAAVDAIHKESPALTYEEIKRRAQKRYGYPQSALKRYTTNPNKK